MEVKHSHNKKVIYLVLKVSIEETSLGRMRAQLKLHGFGIKTYIQFLFISGPSPKKIPREKEMTGFI